MLPDWETSGVTSIEDRFGKNLSHHFKRSGLSKEEVARRAEIHRTQVSLLLNGKQIPKLDTVIKLAGALEIPPAALLEGMGWNPAARASGQFKVSKKR